MSLAVATYGLILVGSLGLIDVVFLKGKLGVFVSSYLPWNK